MKARDLIEAETPKHVFQKVATPENRIEGMKFKSKDEVNVGTPVLHRFTDYGFKGNLWDEKNDSWYKTTGSDHYRVDGFWYCPPGRKFSPGWTAGLTTKAKSTHVSLRGVCGSVMTWEEFFEQCLKPELYYPKTKKGLQGRAFDAPPDQRE